MRSFAVLLCLSIVLHGLPGVASEAAGAAPIDMQHVLSVEERVARGLEANHHARARAWGTLPDSALDRLLTQADAGPAEKGAASDTQDDTQNSAQNSTRNNTGIDARIAALRIERSEIKTRGPRTAAIVGGVLTGVGVVVGATVGLACAAANSDSDTTCRTDRATGIGVAAGVVAVAGVVTLASGLSKLRERNRRRRAIDREILDLRRQREERVGIWPANLRADLQIGAQNRLGFSYRF